VRRADGVFLGIAAALALATALRLPAAWSSGNALNHVSGAWMTLADDVSRGTFYRPPHVSGGGFGGTRFFPLAFVLHGALLRLGADLLASGFALSLAAGALLVLGAFLLLRGLGLSHALAGGFSALALAGLAGQHALSAVRGDLLSVALSAAGLAALARGRPEVRVAAAACAFSLAFAAKPTALTAPAAAVAWLALRGRRGPALALAALVTAGTAGVVAGTNALSGGRFLSLLRLGAGGGASAHDLARAPLRLAEQLGAGDPSGLVLVLAAVVAVGAGAPALFRAIREGRAESPLVLPALWLAFSLAGVIAVLASPGTGMNHLVELEAASAVALGAATRAEGRASRTARLAAPAAALAGFAMALGTWRADVSSSRLHEIRAVVRALPAGGPVFSEDPLVPLLAGERPVVLDPWMLRLAGARDPAVVLPLAADLRRGAFPAVILFRDLADPGADAWYARGNLGLFVAGEIRRGYRRVGGFGRYHLYVPRDHARGAVFRGTAR
jgi:hypothetical protein